MFSCKYCVAKFFIEQFKLYKSLNSIEQFLKCNKNLYSQNL